MKVVNEVFTDMLLVRFSCWASRTSRMLLFASRYWLLTIHFIPLDLLRGIINRLLENKIYGQYQKTKPYEMIKTKNFISKYNQGKKSKNDQSNYFLDDF